MHCHVLVERRNDGYPAVEPREIRLFSKVRTEFLRLPAFLHYYRTLGVDRFFIADNGSSDRTTEYLLDQPHVHVFRTEARFPEATGGTDWLNALLGEFGVGSWCVTLDVDELLYFPGNERASLRTLTKFLDQTGCDALHCLLLDMYPAGPSRIAPTVRATICPLPRPVSTPAHTTESRSSTVPALSSMGDRRYVARLSENPEMTLAYEGSARFEGTAQLVELGIMHDTDVWAAARR